MAKVGVTQLQQRLDGLLQYLQPHWEFVNCHMVNYLTDKHWPRFVPQELRAEIQSVADVELAIEHLFWRNGEDGSDHFPAWSRFLANSQREQLRHSKELLTPVEEVMQGQVEGNPLKIKEFMSPKKCHEVELTAALVDNLIQSTGQAQDFCIIDAGDGKGYLSSRLALQYGHRVLGIDANENNTENALERNRRLQRAWNGLTERAELQSQGITPKRRAKRTLPNQNTPTPAPALDNYKTTAKFITTELDFVALLREHFTPIQHTNSPHICLTGLHTCGNLAATCLQVFHSQTNCRILCNIGCCYHLIKECFSQQEHFGNQSLMDKQTDFGFPLSRYLRDRHITLGRNARMLAAQSIERTVHGQDLPNMTLYYRALLELLVSRQAPHLSNELQVGKVRKFQDFPDYIQKCAHKLNATWLADVSKKELEILLQDYAEDKHYLALFYMLRMTFAPVLESLILLDRLLYLKELDYERSYLIDLFDAVISPRHFAIVAFK